MGLRRYVGSGIAAMLFGSSLSLSTSVPPVVAASGTPIVLPLPDGAVNSFPFAAGGNRVAGLIQPDFRPVVWDFSGTTPAATSLGLPSGVTEAFVVAINDTYAAGNVGPDGQSVPYLWSLTNAANSAPLGVPAGWTGVSPSVIDGNWLVGTGVDASGQPHAVGWNLPSLTPIDLGFLIGKTVVEVKAVVGTWAVGMIADSTTTDGPFQTPVNPRPVAWNLAAPAPVPILLPALETTSPGWFELGSTTGIVSGVGGVFAVGTFERGTFGFEGYEKRAVAWKLGATPSVPVDLGVGKGVDKASGGWVLGSSTSDLVAWDLSQWNGTDPVPSSKVLGSLAVNEFQSPIVSAVVDNWAVGDIYVDGVGQPVVWDLSKANPVPIELTGPVGDLYVSPFTVAGGFIVGSASAEPPSPANSFRPNYRTIAWRISELGGGGGVDSFTVTVTKPTGGSITGSGINCGTSGDVCSITVAPGTEVTLTATADSGKVFTSWGGSCAGSLTTCTQTVSSNRTVTATFAVARTLTITNPVNARISSTTVPAGATSQLNCGNGSTVCSASVVDGTVVQLGIIFNDLYTLDQWTGCDSVSNGVCSVTLTADTTVGVSLKTAGRLLVGPNGGGSITSTDGKINCVLGNPGSCVSVYASGTQVTLTAPPRQDALFLGWTGAICSEGRTSSTCTLTIAELTTTIVYATWQQLAAVTVTPHPWGTVNSTDGRFNCGAGQTVCEVFYRPDSTVTLMTTPRPGYLFTGWKEATGCRTQVNSPTCTLNKWTLNTAEATFAEAVRFTVTRRSGGTITSIDGKIKCGTVHTLCSTLVPKGRTFELKATPDPGNTLGNWMSRFGQGGCQGVDRCFVPVEGDTTFEGMDFLSPATLTLQVPANGRIFQWWFMAGSESTALNCGQGQSKCTASYMVSASSGQQVFLEATASPGWFFAEWVGCESERDICVTSVTKSMTVSAKFVQGTKLTVPGDTGGLITSSDRRIKCGPGFGNCMVEYQGAPRVNLQVEPIPSIRMIVVGWKGCSMNSWSGWAADDWTASSAGCSLTPGADSRVTPVMSRLTDATTRILSKTLGPSPTRQNIEAAAAQIQAGGANCTNLATFIRVLTQLNRSGNLSIADGLVLVSGAKALCPSSVVAGARR